MGDEVACTEAGVDCWMDIVLCMFFSSMVTVCSLTRTVVKGLIVCGIGSLYVAVAILSATFAIGELSGCLSI